MLAKKLSRDLCRNFFNRNFSKIKKVRSLPLLIVAVSALAAVSFAISVESRSSGWLWKGETAKPQINTEQIKNTRRERSFATSPAITNLMAPVVTATKTDSLFTDVDNDNQADPGDTLKYSVVISASGEDATGVTFTDNVDPNTNFVPGSIMTTPLARNDNYSAAGNIRITVAAPGVLANDSDVDGVGPALNVTAGTFLSTQGGNVNLSADGSFTYNPPAGFEGNDSFTYTLNDGEGPSDTGAVSITVSGMIWFIDNNASCPCDGRLTNPFNTLAAFDAVNDSVGNHPATNDNIFVYESATDYVGPVTLEDGQKFIGQDATASLSSISGVTPPAGSDPLPATNSGNGTIVNITSASIGIQVGQDNTLRGFTGGNAGSDIDGASVGTLNISDVTLNGLGRAMSINGGTLNATFGSISSTDSANTGINLIGVGGSLTTGSTSITNPAAVGISLDTSSGSFNFANTSVSGSGNTGVSLTTNTGTITFGSLDISPDASQKALVATDNSNTITATSGTISNSGATAVDISRGVGTTPLNITLTSVSSSGGNSDGISLQNTSGSFSVVGDGTDTSVGGNGTGGTISGKSGADGSTSEGIGVFLNNVSNVTLRRMTINGTNQNFGIRGTTVTAATVEYSTVGGTNGTNVANEGSIIFDGLTGTNTFTNLNVAGAIADNFRVRNSSGIANDIIITGSSFTNAPNDNIIIQPSSSAIVTTHVTNNIFTGAGGDHFQTITSNSATLNVVFTGNLFSNGFPGSLGGGVTISGGNAGSTETVNFNISNNGTVGSPLVGSVQGGTINVNQGAGDGNWQGQVSNNIIGVAGSAGSGSTQSSCIRVENVSPSGDMIASVLNNICREWGSGAGINFQVGGTGNTNASITLTVTGNTITNPGAATQHGVQGNFGVVNSGSYAVCFDFKTNTVNLGGVPPGGGSDLRLRQRNNSTVRLPGYGGANNDATAVANFEIAQNTLQDPPAASQVSVGVAVPPGGGFIGGAACTSPIVPMSMTSEMTANASSTRDSVTDSLDPRRDDILYAVRGENPDKSQVGELTPSEAYAMLQAATARWAEAGLSASNLAKIQSLTVEVADLPAGQLATANSSKLVLDASAAGYGWFFDSTPSDDNEFAVPVPNKERQSIETSAANGRMDLLTALMRELGTQMSRGKSALKGSQAWFMQNTLGVGTRRAPAFKVETTKRLGTRSGDVVVAAIKPKAQQRNVMYQQIASVTGSRNSRAASYRHHPTLVPRAAVPTSFADVLLNIGVLPAGKSITITFQAQVDNPFTGVGSTVCNQGTVSGTNFADVPTDDPDVGGAADPTCTPIDLNADVAVDKSGPATVVAGGNITYTISVTNNGPDGASTLSLSDAVPANTTFVSVTTPAGWTRTDAVPSGGTGTITFTAASLAASATSNFTFVVNVNAGTATGTIITNTVNVASTTPDPSAGNNTDSVNTTVQNNADLAISKSVAPPGPNAAGSNVTYTVDVINNGPSAASNVSFSDVVPAGTSVVSQTNPAGWSCNTLAAGTNGTITCTKASVANGETAQLTVVATVSCSAPNGSLIQNTATVSAASPADNNLANNSSTASFTVSNPAPVVTASVTTSMLPQNSHDLINVGLSASATDGPCGPLTVTVQVFGDEDDQTPTKQNELFSPDAKDIASGTLRLRAERVDDGDGRVYLIVVTATDAAGQTGFATVTVVVPKSSSAANIASVNAQAAAAKAFADANNGAPPAGYFVIGDGPIIGNKQ